MKKKYEIPMAEKIDFDYRNQIVTSGCTAMTLSQMQTPGNCAVEEPSNIWNSPKPY